MKELIKILLKKAKKALKNPNSKMYKKMVENANDKQINTLRDLRDTLVNLNLGNRDD